MSFRYLLVLLAWALLVFSTSGCIENESKFEDDSDPGGTEESGDDSAANGDSSGDGDGDGDGDEAAWRGILITDRAIELMGAIPQRNGLVGTNLYGLSYWSPEWYFIDEMKMASPGWFTQCQNFSGCDMSVIENGWDTGEQAQLDLDDDGWVRSLPAADDASVLYRRVAKLFRKGASGHYQGGRYTVLYEGEGVIEYGMDATLDESQSTPGRHIVDITPSDSGWLLRIADTDPEEVGDYIRNIRVIPPGGICDDARTFVRGESECGGAYFSFEEIYDDLVFHPQFLADLSEYSALRFMDYFAINTSTVTEWSDRLLPDQPSYTGSRGGPLEAAIDLSNLANATPWLNVPVRANDDFVREMARLTHAHLAPSLGVVIEYMNEAWNRAYPFGANGDWILEQARRDWPHISDVEEERETFGIMMDWYGHRTARICEIWREEFGDDAQRVHCTMGGFAANPATTRRALDCPTHVGNGGTPCHEGMDSFAIAPYFAGYLGGNERVHETVDEWIEMGSAGLDRVLEELTGEDALGNPLTQAPLYDPSLEPSWARTPEHGALAGAGHMMETHATLAREYGLEMLAYEGGQHIVGVGERMHVSSFVDFQNAINRQPWMYDVYQRYLDDWGRHGGGLFMHFQTISPYYRYGAWGAKEFQDQPIEDAHKFRAIVDFNKTSSYRLIDGMGRGVWRNSSP